LSIEWRKVEIVPYEGNVSRYINELVELDSIYFGDYGEVWTVRNFLVDLPQKGRLSKLAISNERLIGYLICSSYQNQRRCHVHRLAVHQDYRRLGIAVKLWQESCRECLKLGIEEITLEIPNIATASRSLHGKLGFRPLKGGELANYLTERGKEEKIVHFTDDAEGYGVYFIEVKELWKEFEQ
jgi:ribosomal protein S18 acetylase RimI-like enzyme